MMQSQSRAFFYAGLTILFWSTVATAFKIALEGMPPLDLLFWSTCSSVVLLFLAGLFGGQIRLMFRGSLRDYLRSALLGFINPFVYYLVLFKAYSLLPAQVAQPLNMVWPIVLVFLSVPFLGTRVPLRSYFALMICLAGVFFISARGKIAGYQITEPLGVSLSLGSSLIWATYWLLNMKDARDEVHKLFQSFLFAFIYLLITQSIWGGFSIPAPRSLIAGIYVGIFEMGLSFIFWLKALKYAKSPDQISSFMYLFPFLSLIFIHFILGETIYPTTFIGLILIVAGIFFHKYRFQTKNTV
ncbi:MAG: DMT family transporter [Bacteroidales bacterium]